MEQNKQQNFENHGRTPPGLFLFAAFVFAVNLIWRLAELRHGISFGSVMGVLMAVAFLAALGVARNSTLIVQDRLIRLETRLRLEEVLEAELHPRINQFTVGQLVALRFAGDDELPVLASQVLAENLTDRKEIKRRIKNWQADFLRA